MSALRESARRVLADDPSSALSPFNDGPRAGRARTTDRFAVPLDALADALVERVSIDVRAEGRLEQVTLVLRDGALAWTCTDGTAGREGGAAPSSPWVRVALRWAAGSVEASRPVEPAARSLRPAPEPEPTNGDSVERGRRLADALDDVVLAVVRAGTTGRDSPSVREALDRAARATSRLSPGLSRWIGRLERAMTTGDARTAARLLDGAARAGDDLRGARSGAMARARAAAWLGAPERQDLERIVDRALLEVARESLDGAPRGAIERRYLVDLASGEVLCEERVRSEPAPSLGPCPRSLVVGLAELEDGPAPRRVRVLQYTVGLEVGAAELEKVQAHALRRASVLVDVFREAIAASPALAEPVVVLACAGAEDGRLVDVVGEALPIAREEDAGAAATLDALARTTPPSWVAGRVVETEGEVRLVPCSVGDGARVIRLR